MCEYCEKNISIKVKETLGISIHYPNKLIVRGVDKNGWDTSIDININYCPMCGRKLIEQNEDDLFWKEFIQEQEKLNREEDK